MAIAASDINLRISGGASVTDPNLALGGAMSTVAGGIITSDTLNNDMDDITSSEASAGITIYHGYYYENNHGSLTYIGPKFYIASQTSSGDTSVEVAIADEAKNTAIETIADEETAPSGPAFSTPANFAAGIALGDLEASDYRGIWVKYIVGSSAAAVFDQYTLGIQGDTNP
ncbi:hypothetical protein [Nitrosopumilus sp.]|uniref:hypothetical protein n=1 Tax=Nitrosopumilus sp. TaxID=2024843 RepID=UPI003D0E49CA